jgi:hypothetical protein
MISSWPAPFSPNELLVLSSASFSMSTPHKRNTKRILVEIDDAGIEELLPAEILAHILPFVRDTIVATLRMDGHATRCNPTLVAVILYRTPTTKNQESRGDPKTAALSRLALPPVGIEFSRRIVTLVP